MSKKTSSVCVLSSSHPFSVRVRRIVNRSDQTIYVGKDRPDGRPERIGERRPVKPGEVEVFDES